jgi:hypothetical protein
VTARSARQEWPFRRSLGRLALPPERVRLWALAIAAFGIAPMATALVNGGGDWSVFWSAGATAGTADLLDPGRHTQWQAAHDVAADFWRYPPAFAFLYTPVSWLPIWAGFVINLVAMLGLTAVAGVLLARISGLPRSVALLLAFAWTPATASVDIGQNAPIALVLALWSIDALRRDRDVEAGLALGLLLYKPTLAVFLLGLLLLRGRWQALAVVALVAFGWYLLSVVATAGDWAWPVDWWNGLQPWLGPDLARNGDKAVSLPGLASRFGAPGVVSVLIGAAIFLAALPALIRAPIVEAAAGACLLTVVAGPRVWGYEAGFLLPFLGLVAAGAAGLAEPWRTRVVFAAAPLSLLWLVSAYTVVSGLAVMAAVALAWWLWRWRPSQTLSREAAATR